jgi:lipopolysaccharide/colanic/teichoic acid biosynthesis glycosyltransferase
MAQPVPQEPEPLDFGRVEPSMAPSQDDRERDSVDRVGRIAKRTIDVVLASLMLLMLSPVLLIVVMMIRLTSPGGALFQQVRVGHRGSPFVMLKFRTMHQGLDDAIHRAYVTAMLSGRADPADAKHGIYKLVGDPRVTSIGKFLRKTSLDELPQLVNVLRGEMSLVGPRPVLPWEAELFEPRHQVRFAVKPGITGLWQVTGRNTLTMQQALDLDVEYALRRTILLDLTILLRTMPTVLLSRGAC